MILNDSETESVYWTVQTTALYLLFSFIYETVRLFLLASELFSDSVMR